MGVLPSLGFVLSVSCAALGYARLQRGPLQHVGRFWRHGRFAFARLRSPGILRFAWIRETSTWGLQHASKQWRNENVDFARLRSALRIRETPTWAVAARRRILAAWAFCLRSASLSPRWLF